MNKNQNMREILNIVAKNTLYIAFTASATSLGYPAVNFPFMVLPEQPDSPSFKISDSA